LWKPDPRFRKPVFAKSPTRPPKIIESSYRATWIRPPRNSTRTNLTPPAALSWTFIPCSRCTQYSPVQYTCMRHSGGEVLLNLRSTLLRSSFPQFLLAVNDTVPLGTNYCLLTNSADKLRHAHAIHHMHMPPTTVGRTFFLPLIALEPKLSEVQ
jgi:hypothetical protein